MDCDYLQDFVVPESVSADLPPRIHIILVFQS